MKIIIQSGVNFYTFKTSYSIMIAIVEPYWKEKLPKFVGESR